MSDFQMPPEWGGRAVVERRGPLSKSVFVAEVMWMKSNYIVSGKLHLTREAAMAEAETKLEALRAALLEAGMKEMNGCKIAKG